MGENICKPLSEQGIISKIFKELLQLDPDEIATLQAGNETKQGSVGKDRGNWNLHPAGRAQSGAVAWLTKPRTAHHQVQQLLLWYTSKSQKQGLTEMPMHPSSSQGCSQ